MNTRLQVEHPVTELITGLDLVEWQLRVANGEQLPLKQQELTLNGHVLKCVCMQKTHVRLLPQTGKILRWKPATLPNVRIDHGMLAPDEVSPFYDPMVAKVIAYGKTREDAIRLLARAVDDSVLLGVNSNKQFLVNLLRHPVVVAGDTNTAFIQQHFKNDPSLHYQVLSLETLAIAAALFSQSKGTAVWQTGLGVPLPLKLQTADQQIQLQLSSVNNIFTVKFCDQVVCIDMLEKTPEQLVYLIDGVLRRVQYVLDDDQLYLDRDNGNVLIRNMTYAAPEATDVAGDGKIRAPMDGAVVNILVNEGDQVVKGQTLLILEAMKIQQQIKFDVDGVIDEILGQQGQQVKNGKCYLVSKFKRRAIVVTSNHY